MLRLLSLLAVAGLIGMIGVGDLRPKTAGAQATPPARYYGTATVNGRPAAPGTPVLAFIGGIVCGSGVADVYGFYQMDIGAGCGSGYTIVTFTVGGFPARQTATFLPGYFVPVNLTVVTEPVPLAAGCNNVALTWPDATPSSTVAGAVSPPDTLSALWRLDNATQRFQGFAPGFPTVSDLPTVNRLDAVFFCISRPGTLARPRV